MRLSQLFTKTHKEAPRDETARSAQYLLRAGFIYKEMAGVYSFLPLGFKVLRKIEQIVREEMDAIGAQELQLTALQDRQIWEATDRWDEKKVDVWFKTQLQNGTALGLAFSHEEPMTRIVSHYANSYKDLPLLTYQFQWKLRNELRAKSGIMRGREFRMKDMYSFSATPEQHEELYRKAQEAYKKVYDRLGIGGQTYFTYASGGVFSKFSHEYQTVLDVGEDTIYVDDSKRIAFNDEDEIMSDDLLKELKVDRSKLREIASSEVGNIFPLGTKYSEALGAVFSDEEGRQHPMIMGSYGIGVSRLVGVLAEFFSDDKGMVWPDSVAPAAVHLVRIGNDPDVQSAADKLYEQLLKEKVEILYDDRDESAGAKFADADLIGIPIRLTISPKTLKDDSVELKYRSQADSKLVKLSDLKKSLNF